MPYLLKDFGQRCAYSLYHNELGDEGLEVDHFNPKLKGVARNMYSNLMPALGVCNRFKRDKWPTPELEAQGIRFIDPTKEADYGHQIFEDPATHKLIGTTIAARYHITHLRLNCDFLIRERTKRATLRKIFNSPVFYKKEFEDAVLADCGVAVSAALDLVNKMIPDIPPPPLA